MTKCYSFDCETFHTEIDSVNDDVNGEFNIGDKVCYFVGDLEQKTHSDFIDIECVIENMQEKAGNDFGENAYSYLSDMTNKQAEELKNLISEYLDKAVSKVSFFGVSNVKEISVIWDGDCVTNGEDNE